MLMLIWWVKKDWQGPLLLTPLTLSVTPKTLHLFNLNFWVHVKSDSRFFSSKRSNTCLKTRTPGNVGTLRYVKRGKDTTDLLWSCNTWEQVLWQWWKSQQVGWGNGALQHKELLTVLTTRLFGDHPVPARLSCSLICQPCPHLNVDSYRVSRKILRGGSWMYLEYLKYLEFDIKWYLTTGQTVLDRFENRFYMTVIMERKHFSWSG